MLTVHCVQVTGMVLLIISGAHHVSYRTGNTGIVETLRCLCGGVYT